jgi:hypothetical protein
MLSRLFRPRRRSAVYNEKQSHLPISRFIPEPVVDSDICSCGHDNATHSRALLENNAGIITSTQASPTSLGTILSTQVNTGTLESLSRPEDEFGSHHNVRAPLSPFGKKGSHIESDVRNLTGHVVIDTYRPVFEGIYSNVYRGIYGNQEV